MTKTSIHTPDARPDAESAYRSVPWRGRPVNGDAGAAAADYKAPRLASHKVLAPRDVEPDDMTMSERSEDAIVVGATVAFGILAGFGLWHFAIWVIDRVMR